MKPLIMLVEDNRTQRLTNERILVKAGYNVVSVGDGEEAIRVACDRLPQLILLDMLLPKANGVEVIQALKGHRTTAHIPVVVLSSLPQVNETKLMREGAAGYFEKSRIVSDKNGEAIFCELLEKVLQSARDSAAAG